MNTISPYGLCHISMSGSEKLQKLRDFSSRIDISYLNRLATRPFLRLTKGGEASIESGACYNEVEMMLKAEEILHHTTKGASIKYENILSSTGGIFWSIPKHHSASNIPRFRSNSKHLYNLEKTDVLISHKKEILAIKSS